MESTLPHDLWNSLNKSLRCNVRKVSTSTNKQARGYLGEGFFQNPPLSFRGRSHIYHRDPLGRTCLFPWNPPPAHLLHQPTSFQLRASRSDSATMCGRYQTAQGHTLLNSKETVEPCAMTREKTAPSTK